MPAKSLPAHPSLAHLKYQAKDLLTGFKQNSPDATSRIQKHHPRFLNRPRATGDFSLADAQLVIAREYGFETWPKLKARVEEQKKTEPRRPMLADYQKVAQDLVEAFHTGNARAMESVWTHFGNRRTWETTRQYALLDLGRRSDPANPDTKISLEEAQFLVARGLGHESWSALAKYFAELPKEKILVAIKPVSLFTTGGDGERETITKAREWETVFESIRRRKIPGLAAEGQMTDFLIEHISRLDHVTSLDLSGSHELTDVGARFLVKMPHLEHLDLSGTGITDRGLEILSRLESLKSIKLTWTSVTDAGIAHLARCNHLERADLFGTRTGDGAIKALAGKSRLAHFMSGVEMTDAGIKWFQEYPVFKTWCEGAASINLLKPEAKPNHLGLHGVLTNKGFADLAGLDGLFALNADNSKLALTGAALASIVNLPNLGWLGFDAKDDAMPYIASMPKLRLLMCQDTEATDNGFIALSRSTSIEKIWGRRSHNLRARGFKALATMPALQGLSVSCKNVDDSGLAALPHFPALRELMPMDVPDAGYLHVGRCKKLDSLVLMYCRETSDIATEYIAGLPALRKYFASYTKITDRSMELLSRMQSLEEIVFYGCPEVTNQGVCLLARLPRLRKLETSGPKITSECAPAFASRVKARFSE